jgi:hypothetical protein
MHSSKCCLVSCMLSGMFGRTQHTACYQVDVEMCGEMLLVHRLSLRFSAKYNALNDCFPNVFARGPILVYKSNYGSSHLC